MAAILRVRNENGEVIDIPALIGPRGERGETGPAGPQGPAGNGSGDMLASVYDSQNKKQDVFQYVDNAISSHKPAASTITAGTFAGQVVANSSGQNYSTSLLRNSKLVSTETTPTVNGEIYWTYE